MFKFMFFRGLGGVAPDNGVAFNRSRADGARYSDGVAPHNGVAFNNAVGINTASHPLRSLSGLCALAALLLSFALPNAVGATCQNLEQDKNDTADAIKKEQDNNANKMDEAAVKAWKKSIKGSIYVNNVNRVAELLKAAPHLVDTDIGQETQWNHGNIKPLTYAAWNGRAKIARLLLQAGAQVDLRVDRGSTALIYAAKNGHAEVIKQLLIAGAQVDMKDTDNNTALWYAVNSRRSSLSVLKLLLKAGADVNVHSRRGATPLMRSVQRTPEHMKLLLQYGAHLEARDDDGDTALMWALGETLNKIQILLDAGADVHVQNRNGYTALMRATNFSPEAVKLLLEAGADVNRRSHTSWTPLMSALEFLAPESAKILIAAGADINYQNDDGDTALVVAIDTREIRLVKLLLEAGAQIDENLIEYVMSGGDVELIRLVIEYDLKQKN